MKCPYCGADNLPKRDVCYNCNKDVSMLRLIVNKSRHHYNRGLEHAERQRYSEAVAELISAIELDNSFVNSYVVLGTIYMKLEQPERAQEVWLRALALDPSIQKAHQYLGKIGHAGAINARVRVLRSLILLTLLSLLACAGLLGYFLVPDSEIIRFDTAIAQYRAGEYIQALDNFGSLNNTFRYPQLKELGEKFTALIRGTLDERFAAIEHSIQLGEYYQGMEQLERLSAGKLPQSYRVRRDRARGAAFSGKKNSLQAQIAALESTGDGIDALQKELTLFGKYFSGDEARALQKSARAAVDKTRALQKFIEYDAGLAGLDDPLEKLLRLRRYEEQNPIRLTQLDERCEALKTEVCRNRETRFAGAVQQGDLAQAAELFEQREDWLRYCGDDARQRIETDWPEQLRQLRIRNFAAELGRLTYMDAVKLAELAKHLPEDASPQQIAELRARIQETKKSFARQIFQHCGEIENQFIDDAVNPADARLIADNLQLTLEQLPPFTLQYAKDNLLFYAATANAALGKSKLAADIYGRVLKEFPRSRYAALAQERLAQLKLKG